MLRPHRHMDLQTSPIYVGQVVLEVLQSQGCVSVHDLDREVRDRCGDVGPRRLQEVLVLLYALGVLDYLDERDLLIPTRTEGDRVEAQEQGGAARSARPGDELRRGEGRRRSLRLTTRLNRLRGAEKLVPRRAIP